MNFDPGAAENELETSGSPWIGISMHVPDYTEYNKYGMPEMSSVRVYSVKNGSPAEEAGIREGDFILKIGETVIQSLGQAHRCVQASNIGDIVLFELRREFEILKLKVKVGRTYEW